MACVPQFDTMHPSVSLGANFNDRNSELLLLFRENRFSQKAVDVIAEKAYTNCVKKSRKTMGVEEMPVWNWRRLHQ